MLGLLLVAAGLVWVLNGRDAPPPDVTDLEVVLEPVPAAANAFTYLTDGRGGVANADGSAVDDAALGTWAEMAQGRTGTEWDGAGVAALVQANTAALQDLRAAGQAPHAQLPDLDFSAVLPDFLTIRRLANLGLAHAEQLRRAGDHAGALAMAMDVTRLGNRLQTGSGSLICVMIGNAVETMGLGAVRFIVADAACPAAACDAVAAELAALRDRGPGLALAFRCEYTMAAKYLDTVQEPGQIANITGSPMPKALDRGPGFFLHPNRTKRMLADDYRLLVANALLPPGKGRPIPEPPSYDGFWGSVRLVAGGNAVGHILHRIVLPGVQRSIEARASADAQSRCTLAFVRATAHLRRTGALPAALADCLDPVPLDPFDGKPLRYDATKRVIWSVGKNGTDEGGNVASGAVPTPTDRHWPHDAADPGLTLPAK